MKIRDGFVTNSSSTNFLIISKNELTEEYLYKKLGFKEDSPIKELGLQLCEEILNGIGLRYFEIEELNYDNVKKFFGKNTANKYQKLINKNFHAYIGSTGSDESTLTCFFTTDSFEIDDKDFYLNGKSCVW